MAEIKMEITKEIGAIGKTSDKGWTLELNMVSWNDAKPKYDIRTWNDDHSKCGKGITLTADELKKLLEVAGKEMEE